MMPKSDKSPAPATTKQQLLREMEELRARLEEAEDTIQAIQTGGVDALIVSGPEGERVFALEGVDYAYRVLVEVMNEGVVTLGPDGGILSCNSRFTNFIKAPAEDILGRNLEQFVAPAAQHTLRAFLHDTSEEGRVINADLLRADGTTMPAKLSAGTYEVGGLPALCIVVTDMTAFYDMAKTQMWLASIVNSSHDAVISKSLDNTILTWNAGAERMYGYSAEEAVGRPISIIVPADRAQEIGMIDDNADHARSFDGFETVRVTKSGALIQVSLTVSPVGDMQGNITGASVIARDITQRKKIERELDEHRWYLEDMVRKRTKELSDRSEELQTVNEELQARGEELGIANEELMAQAGELRLQQEQLRVANQALLASREAETLRTAELQAVLDTMPAAIMITRDPEAREMTGNRAAEELLCVPHGANLSDLGWHTIKPGTLFVTRDGEKLPLEELPVLRAAREGVAVHDCEYDVVSGDGTIRHMVGNATPLNSGGAVGAFIDITERRRIEDAIRQHNETMEAINGILNAALSSDTEEQLGMACLKIAEGITRSKFGFIGDINEEGLEDIAISNPGWEACVMTYAGGHRVPPKAFKIHGIYGRVLIDAKPVLTNDPANHPDAIGLPPGHPPLEAFLGVPLIHADRTMGIVAVGNREGGYTLADQELLEALAPAIVEAFLRKRAEDALKRNHEVLEHRVQQRTMELSDANEELRKSANRLDEAQHMAHLGNWDLDLTTNTDRWSDETFRLLGFEPQTVAPSYELFLARVHPDDRPRVSEAIKNVVDRGEPYRMHYRVLLPNGDIRHMAAQAERFLDDQGKLVRQAGTLMDVTEQVRAREEAELRQTQLVQADKMVSLGILTSGVAHEINNPNHSIMSNASLLADAWTDIRPLLEREYEASGDFVIAGFDYSRAREEFPKILHDIMSGSRRIEAIVSELRDYARYNPEGTRTPIDLQPVIESACHLLASMIKKSTDHFDLSLEANLPKITANRQRIEQVLINLIQNACQALPDSRKAVSVTAAHSPENRAVTIIVNDEGTGIPPEHLKHLGDPFFTTKRATGGTGLGLSVSFNIVREHGGTLDFVSIPGKGTRAQLTLPVSEAQ